MGLGGLLRGPRPERQTLKSASRRGPPDTTAYPYWLALPVAVFFLVVFPPLHLRSVQDAFGLQFNLKSAQDAFVLHGNVLAGRAPSPYQCQMWVHSLAVEILARVFDGSPLRAFSRAYTLYTALGWLLALGAAHRLARRWVHPSTAVIACLALAASLPLFVFDNYFHPGDPWGLFLAFLVLENAVSGKKTHTALYLFLSGFLWEKHLLFPFSLALAQWMKGRGGWREALRDLAVNLPLAAFGQVLFRFQFGSSLSLDGATVGWDNLGQMPWHFLWAFVLWGPAAFAATRRWGRLPVLWVCLALQYPLFLAVFLALGHAREMRSYLVLVAFLWPLTCLGWGDFIGEKKMKAVVRY